MIDIIIPTFNQEMHTVRCLKSIKKFTHLDYRIVWIDNGSSYKSRQIVLLELKDHYLSIWLPDRVGFIRAINIAIKQCKNEYLVILNNDTEVTKDWLDLLLFPLKENSNIVASGPLTTINTSHQDIKRMQAVLPELNRIKNKHLMNINLLQKSLYDIFGPSFFIQMESLAFFCTVFKRSIFDIIGFLDERFSEGYSDDIDFSMRIKQKGYELILVPAAYVEHYHKQTFLSIYNENKTSEILQMNRKLLNKKWNMKHE